MTHSVVAIILLQEKAFQFNYFYARGKDDHGFLQTLNAIPSYVNQMKMPQGFEVILNGLLDPQLKLC